MPVLYLAEQGATLRKKGDTLVVTKNDNHLQVIPASQVEQVVVFGNVNITTPVIHYLLFEGKDCVFCSSTGAYHGRLFSTESRFGLLRRLQLETVGNDKTRLSLAAAIVRAKLSNQRTLLLRYRRRSGDASLGGAIEGLDVALSRVNKANDIGSVLGIEGYASTLYFGAFRTLLKQELGFVGRRRRPPPDPVNSLLSLGYTLLVYDAQAAVRVVGLDPFLGFLHSTEYSKPSLALDLVEEFRTVVVDSLVLRIINTRAMTGEDFTRSVDRQGMVRLKGQALKEFIRHYEERMNTGVTHPALNVKTTYRRCLELQARQIARIATGKQGEYRPFLVK